MGCRAAGQGRFMAEPTLATQGSTLWGRVEGSGGELSGALERVPLAWPELGRAGLG